MRLISPPLSRYEQSNYEQNNSMYKNQKIEKKMKVQLQPKELEEQNKENEKLILAKCFERLIEKLNSQEELILELKKEINTLNKDIKFLSNKVSSLDLIDNKKSTENLTKEVGLLNKTLKNISYDHQTSSSSNLNSQEIVQATLENQKEFLVKEEINNKNEHQAQASFQAQTQTSMNDECKTNFLTNLVENFISEEKKVENLKAKNINEMNTALKKINSHITDISLSDKTYSKRCQFYMIKKLMSNFPVFNYNELNQHIKIFRTKEVKDTLRFSYLENGKEFTIDNGEKINLNLIKAKENLNKIIFYGKVKNYLFIFVFYGYDYNVKNIFDNCYDVFVYNITGKAISTIEENLYLYDDESCFIEVCKKTFNYLQE